jgi:signal transduction histidine kinase
MLVVFLFAAGVSGAGEFALVVHKLRHAETRQQEYAFRLQAVAHEIATPLTAIQASSEIISDGCLTDAKRIEMAGLIHKESQRLNSVLRAFLDVERIASGKLKIQKAESDLRGLCDDVVRAARLYASRKRTQVESDIGAVTVRVDAELLSFAIYNLLTNAVKYSPKESRVQLTATKAGGEVTITVADQGYGVAPEEQTRIFDRFYRLKRDLHGGEAGNGIGLALVREIVLQHGGRISVDSKPGAGSRFTITLPGD